MSLTDKQFSELLESAPKNANIHKYLMVTRAKLSEYRRIAVSYSGGSDSDIMLDMVELVKPSDCGEIKYVYFDSSLEYMATRRHVTETEQRYGVEIERRKPKESMREVCNKHGVPFICKDASAHIDLLQRHDFDWKDLPESATVGKYGRCKSALDWYFDRRAPVKSGKSKFSIKRFKLLREFIISNPPEFAISDKCCDYIKKEPAACFNKEFVPDLQITGMRQAEGGRRAGSIKSCFTPSDGRVPYNNYRPLWFWSDADKQIYKEWRGIRYSDCYEIWGFKRTGCVGCPCSSNAVKDLEIAAQYEPHKVKAAYGVFRKSYEYRAKYNEFKKNYNKYEDELSQMSLFDETASEIAFNVL